MALVSAPADYKSELPGDKPVGSTTATADLKVRTTKPADATATADLKVRTTKPPDTAARPDDLAAIEEFLNLLARAVRQFHTYPAGSPFRAQAIAACHKSLAAIDRRDQLGLRVTPAELIADDVKLGAHTIIEQELARRLHRAHVVGIDIDRAATAKHLSSFCADVIRCEEVSKREITLADLLVEHGVETIVARMADRPEVLDVGAPPAPVCDLVGHEQHRQRSTFAADASAVFLYPPNKGWVRIDPATRLDAVSLIDLAILVDDPSALATMLLRLTDEETTGPDQRKTALERKFSDVATLFAALDPRLARVMFGKLSRAVLELSPDSRTELLRRTILPGLLDGRPDGTVLGDFPDADLADSLCLLLELETAAPEVLTAALNRLDLPAERRESVIPLIDGRLRNAGNQATAAGPARQNHFERFARRLIRIDANAQKDFTDFSTFDLSIDDNAAAAIVAARESLDGTDLLLAQLGYLFNLVRLEARSELVEVLLRRTLPLLTELARSGRWHDVAAWGSCHRQFADEIREARPDVAEAILQMLTAFCLPGRASTLAALYERDDDGRRTASAVVEAFGVAMVPALIAIVDDPVWKSKSAAAVSLMCEHAKVLAPALTRQLRRAGLQPTRSIMKVLGFAGTGHETVIAEQLDRADEPTATEALRALARIGTRQAASLVARQLRSDDPARRAAAEDALWQFPPARAAVEIQQLLGNRDFVDQHPDISASLLTRADQARTSLADDVLAKLEQLRFHFWKPALMRVARKARQLRRQ